MARRPGTGAPALIPFDRSLATWQEAGIGRAFGDRYRVDGLLGTGGSGSVFLAHDLQLARPVAVKVLSADMASDAEGAQRLQDEARLMALLDHPNCVRVFDFQQQAAAAFIVMEFVDGSTLRRVIDIAKRLSGEQAVGVMSGAMAGLGHAHDVRLVHRDITPNNILCDRAGVSKLTDFGLAALRDQQTLGRAGSPSFMSPEADRGEKLTPAADIYGCAAVLFALLTGRPPFQGDQPAAIARARALGPVPDPRGIAPATPEGLARLVMRALDPDPAARPASATELGQELAAAAAAGYGPDWATRGSIAGLAPAATIAALAPASTAGGGTTAGTSLVGEAGVMTAVGLGAGVAAATMPQTAGAPLQEPTPPSPARPAGGQGGTSARLLLAVGAAIAVLGIGGVIWGGRIPTGPGHDHPASASRPGGVPLPAASAAGATVQWHQLTPMMRVSTMTSDGSGGVVFAASDGKLHEVGRASADGKVTEVTLPADIAPPEQIGLDGTGNLWWTSGFFGIYKMAIVRMAPDGTIATFPTDPQHSDLGSINGPAILGPDGTIWLAARQVDRMVRVTADGKFVALGSAFQGTPLPAHAAGTNLLTHAGKVWMMGFKSPDANHTVASVSEAVILSLDPAGVVTQYPTGHTGDGNNAAFGGSLAVGPDGAIWYTGGNWDSNAFGRLGDDGTVTQFRLPANWGGGGIAGDDLVAGPDGRLWLAGAYPAGLQPIVARATLDGKYVPCVVADRGAFNGPPLPTEDYAVSHIAVGRGGKLWVFMANRGIGLLTPTC